MNRNNGKPTGAVLVIGGGIAGIQASIDLADSGYKVYLLEKSSAIGGNMPRLDKTFPTNDCSMCILSPKIVECGRHLNIEALTWSRLEHVSGSAGNFKVKIRKRARFVDLSKCTGCGECAEACPVTVASEFDALLAERKAIFRSYPQAYPNAFVIDKQLFPACRNACPAGVNVHGFVALMAQGKFDESLELYRTRNPFPASCGRICDHPCQEACNRSKVDESLAIRTLHRFLADREISAAQKGKPPELTEEIKEKRKAEFPRRGKGRKVAVVGSGPAGLTCAWALANMGYKPVVFESLDVAGGMLRIGVPQYRLPVEVLDYEIEAIKQAGVEIRLNNPVGTDLTFKDLFDQGFKAIFVAVGTHKSRNLDIEGIFLDGVIHGTGFLEQVKVAQPPDLSGKVVAIIGGGNVAIDVARTAVRIGARETHVACLESPEEMFASQEEVDAAIEEGVIIHNRHAPKRFLGRDKYVCGIEFVDCLSVFDENDRFNPVVQPGTERTMPVDTVVVAIGQGVDWEMLKAADDKLEYRAGLISADNTFATGIKGVFAGGDAVTGPDVAVSAIAAGHKASISIDRYLNGEDLSKDRDDLDAVSPDKIASIPEGTHSHTPQVKVSELPVEKRIKSFVEVETGINEEQAIIEAKRCRHCTICSECLQCVQACKADAIFHDQQDEIVDIDVGALVVVPGFKEFMAGLKYDLGYSRYPDVVSSFEFERILSASGPFTGHVKRLSDGMEPKKIAFLQCIGSRDISCGNRYCSSVCCMYAIKEAVIAKEHMGELDVTIFFMDLRAFGKDFDKYYERAKNEYGVQFIRARVNDVSHADGNGQLMVQYVNDAGLIDRDQFDMVVLSVGLEPSEKTRELAEKLSLRLKPNGFIWTEPADPLQTSREGVFTGGAASGPKDIPETVTQASATAARASQLLSESRHTLTIEREFPPERDVTGLKPRIGVFICHCGINIGGTVNVPVITEFAGYLPNVVHAENNLYTCSQDTQDHIRDMIIEHDLNRVIVASCSPRTHEPMFRDTCRDAGINPYLFEMANIRDQCSWIHRNEPEKATEKAKELVHMAVAKARNLEPLYSISMLINNDALVIGGGITGMTAALSLARQGFEVNLIEKEKELGGNMRHIHFLIDGEDPRKQLKETIRKVNDHPNITVWTDTNIELVDGFVGNFRTTISSNGKESEIEHGVVIVATGAAAYSPAEYLYGSDERILTQLELEEKLAEGKIDAERVVMIQCVGSREEGHMYCSRVCCSTAVKNALKIKELSPETEIYVLYRDMRTYGFNEEYFQTARDRGVIFIRYDLDSKPEVRSNNGLTVMAREPLLQRELELNPDLLVLSSRIDANPDNKNLALMLKIPVNEDGFFLEAHMKLRPVDFATEGVFLAGMAHSPKSIQESIAQGEAAASRAATIISKEKYDAEATISSVNEDICSGCGVCASVCEFEALEVIEQPDGGRVVKINEALCKGCGCCAGVCPSGAMEQKGFKSFQILNAIDAALI